MNVKMEMQTAGKIEALKTSKASALFFDPDPFRQLEPRCGDAPSVAKPRSALEPKCAPAMRGASMGPAAHFQEVVLEPKPTPRQGHEASSAFSTL